MTPARCSRRCVRFANDLPWNKTHSGLRVNVLEYGAIGEGQERLVSSVTASVLRRANGEALLNGGRARWPLENEPFNPLKNQGDYREQNSGHGQLH